VPAATAKRRAPVIRIIRPSSREAQDLLAPRVAELEDLGFEVRHDELAPDPSWAYAAATAESRAAALMAALVEDGTEAVVCARGGYGASDLLPLLDWAALARAKEKLVVGFSDVSALHTALYARLGWRGIHGPMPATTLWRKGGVNDDVDALLAALKAWSENAPASGTMALAPVGPATSPASTASGKLFGGCFSVVTGLIGTPSFPRSLAGHVLFFEDTDEHPGRLMRHLNQWIQSGALAGVTGLVIGHLRGLGDKIPDCAPFVLEQFARRTGLPTWHAPLFGHTTPNFPLVVGATATIEKDRLSWRAEAEAKPHQDAGRARREA
jgi:muramoyltetrapeptide carboxypeptidase